MAEIVLAFFRIEDKVRILLIDSIVGEMHAHIMDVLFRRLGVLNCSKACQAFSKHEDLEWAHTLEHNVDSKVELQSIDEKRIFNIFLHNIMVIRV